MQDNVSYSEPTNLEEGLDIREYLALFWQWLWLIVLVAVVAGAGTYFYVSRQTPIYQATARIMINTAPGTVSTDYSSVLLSQQLTSTYAMIINTEPVMQEVANRLQLNINPRVLAGMVKTTPVTNTSLMDVTVESSDRGLVAALANTTVEVFSEQIKDKQTERFSVSKVKLSTQMAVVESDINNYSTQVAALPTQNPERENIDSKIAQYRGIYSSYVQSYEAIRLAEAQSVSSISTIQPAVNPGGPIRPVPLQSGLLAGVVGFLLAAGGVFAREMLDDTLKTPEEVSRVLGLPVLAVIHHHTAEAGRPITESSPRSPVAEGFRKLRTNVQYASVDRPLRTILVTSPEPGEGKTTIAANLAVALAHNERWVTLVDCDLRRPAVHHTFNLPNRSGLTNLFVDAKAKVAEVLQISGVNQLDILTSGSTPPNPAELLGSQRMQAIFEEILQNSDVVVVDSPPTLAVTDSSVLASSVDGVLLVLKPGFTRRGVARQAVQQLQRANARILGAVLNNLDLGRAGYGYRYYYHKYYPTYAKYYSSDKDKKNGSGKANGNGSGNGNGADAPARSRTRSASPENGSSTPK